MSEWVVFLGGYSTLKKEEEKWLYIETWCLII
jgi:hypothetical protein